MLPGIAKQSLKDLVVNVTGTQGGEMPWRLNQDYMEDRRDLRERPVEDGVLIFERQTVAQPSELA